MMEAIEALPAIECGEDAAKYFDFDEGWRNLNHGMFFALPIDIQ